MIFFFFFKSSSEREEDKFRLLERSSFPSPLHVVLIYLFSRDNRIIIPDNYHESRTTSDYVFRRRIKIAHTFAKYLNLQNVTEVPFAKTLSARIAWFFENEL